ncbi:MULTISPECIES: cob(I)yrinic acid a,c-diamide adenosyltransferase [Asticcacaulis]|uniref:cob(I)yrinic acid a,c-diamide adenosyltransferase n=1 Tax=Asticcacaulis TaxID=76890 RepID=UPI001AE2FD81|nr:MULTISPECIES: cob(I)yrinic acid a,c-diamide adenosyltransferase [Asticcacaulis]MBP2158039.1 cob(I)alamin adenosyltransferase [Asticcacaulis solisilvae]MDR6799084.1 cob(I)alamin adenosyltransferase [Asticcacaulis sp. BE141]
MVKLNKIYTRTGDDGTTGLADGSRRPKSDARLAAIGSVDEANAAIGVARLYAAEGVDALLARVQNDLFDLGADLATPSDDVSWTPLRIKAHQVDALEAALDSHNAELSPLTSFILPAGTPLSAYLHMARTIVRRAERDTVAMIEPVNPDVMKYLNRLSDLLFVLARHANDLGRGDVLWVPSK